MVHKKVMLGLLWFVSLPLMAQITLNNTEQQALQLVKDAGGKAKVLSANYIEANSFSNPIVGKVTPNKVGFYTTGYENSQTGQIYCVIYSLNTEADLNTVIKTLAQFPVKTDKVMSADENDRYLQLVIKDNGDFIFILMDTVVAKAEAPDEYAILKKTIQNWQNLLTPFVSHNGLGLTFAEVKALAKGKVAYEGDKTEGELLANGDSIYNYNVYSVYVVFSKEEKVIQSVWLFSNPTEWTRFLSIEGRGADLLLQADIAMQQALARGETIEYALDDNTLLRFWSDESGHGVAFGDAKVILGKP